MSKHKTVARLQAVAAARDEALSMISATTFTKLEVERRSLESLSVIVPRNAFERVCIGCGAKVIPGLTNHCDH